MRRMLGVALAFGLMVIERDMRNGVLKLLLIICHKHKKCSAMRVNYERRFV
jgi:hypothetical protein